MTVGASREAPSRLASPKLRMRYPNVRPAGAFELEDDHFHDECGVFGIFGHSEAANMTYLGLHALQHRGQESAGIVTSDGTSLFAHRSMGLVQDAFTQEQLANLPGRTA